MNLNVEGLIPILGGVYALLIAYRIVPVSKDPARKEYVDKWMPRLKWLAPLLIVFGFLLLFRFV